MAYNANPPTYEAFYDAARAYASDLIMQAARIKTSCDVIAQVIEDEYLEPAELLAEKGLALREKTRGCFWPEAAFRMLHQMPTEGAAAIDDDHNRARWQPYDQQAWDDFLAEVAANLGPDIVEMRQLAESLPLLDDYQLPQLQKIASLLFDALNKLEAQLQS